MLFVGAVVEQVACDFLACAVHVALLENAENGVQSAILRIDFRQVRVDGGRHELRHANLFDVRVVAEGAFDIFHVGTATREDDAAEQLVDVLVGHLEPRILDDFLDASLDNVDEVAAEDVALLVDGQRERVVDVAVVGVGAAIFQFHALGFVFLHLQRGNVFRDVVAAERNHGQVAQNVLVIDADGGCVGSEIDEHAARAFFRLGEHAVGHREGCEIHFGDGDACLLETFVEIAVELLPPENVEEISLEARTLDAHWVELILLIDLVFLCGSVENLLFGIRRVAVLVHQFVDHLWCDNRQAAHLPENHVLDAANALSTHAHIDLCDFRLERRFQFLDDVGHTHHGLVDVIDHALANT